MRDVGLVSFFGNAPDWSEQGKRQKEYVKALEEYEKWEEEQKEKFKNDNS